MTIVPADAKAIARAAETLREGGLVAIPTETVYGLAADSANPPAIARVFAAKGRPRFNPLIVHVRDLEEALRHGDLHANARALAERFWPGPLTLVAPRRAESAVCDLACAGLASIALRAPAHKVARAVLAAFDAPFAAPSANRSGHVSPTTAAHVAADLAASVDLILDGGPCAIGVESTIIAIDASGAATLLRPGAIPRTDIESIVGPLASPRAATIAAPGMLQSHYAPRARLRLDAAAPRAGETYLGFGAHAHGEHTLSRAGDLTEAAANLYAMLREIDATGAGVIAVAPIPALGLGEAIRDRLVRAATR